ncbi:MAG TPA: VWA domain-containing protein [Pyrinomonadaceae bacterium]|nr:VWA domain-containing protein [Pyrinomonadaceae bacterium]
MGQLASHDSRGRATHERRRLTETPGNRLLTRRARRKLTRRTRACVSLSLILLLLAPHAVIAQSGRNKPPTPTGAPRGEAQRPRIVNPLPPAQPAATPTASPTIDDTDAPARPAPSTTTTTNAATPKPGVPAASSSVPVSTATSANPTEVDEDEVVQIHSNLVPVPASVLDAQGRAVTDLQLKDFELMVDGVRREIGELSRSETPVTMAVLFDNSSSLRAGREFEVKAAVHFFKTVMRPIDRAAVYSVSTVPVLVRPLTNDVNALVRTVENFDKPEGATALFDAISTAAAYLKPQTGRKVIVIVSDGTDTISDLDFDTTLAHVLAADCQIYAVQTGHSDNTNLRDLAAERRLQEFTAQTGGALYVPRGNSDLDRAFTQIAADLAQQYILSYYPTEERRDGRFRTFSLRVPTRQGLRVRTRRGYYAPKS